jgi:hypothetical protein
MWFEKGISQLVMPVIREPGEATKGEQYLLVEPLGFV